MANATGVKHHLKLLDDDWPGVMNNEEILVCLMEVTKGTFLQGIDQMQSERIVSAAYDIIDVLSKDADGSSNSGTVSKLMKSLLLKLLAVCKDHNAVVNLVTCYYISFIRLIIRRYKKSTQDLYILLQHLCCCLVSLEKNDVRMARASLVLSLMPMLPKRSFAKFIKWLLKLTCYSHVMHRHMALEVLGRVLECNVLLHDSGEAGTPQESQESGIYSDVEMGESSQNDSQSTSTAPVSRNSSSGIESQEVEEEPNTDGSPANQHTLNFVEVLITIEQCLADVNCNVRMRALSLLTKCATSTRPHVRKAAEEFDKSGSGTRLMSIAILMSGDERATVKRAALELLLHLIRVGGVDEKSLEMLVNLCRDVSVQVRAATISALTGHCMSNPGPVVLDAFVSGPLHQLHDTEQKIQDQVISSMKQMFDTLKPYEVTATNSQAWLLLDAITKRNKRKYLESACALMSKKFKCINSKLIDILATHLGKYDPPDRSLHAMVLLSCVGKYTKHTNVNFLLQYFYNLASSERNDCREVLLCVELLSVWSSSLTESDRASLRAYIIKGIESGTLGDHGTRASCLLLPSNLDRDNLQWVTEHMKTLMRGTEKNSPVSLLAELADLTLVLSEKPPYAIVKLLMKKLTQKDLDPASSGIVVASLGRMCLRSYEICRRVAPALGEVLLLRDGPLPQRVNALIVLEDICAKHSGIVEPLMNTICTCLEQDAPTLLRRTAARSITMLLLKQFLKLRTPLYFNYCALALDSDSEVRQLCLNFVLYRLEPNFVLNHFVDGVLYYNHTGPHASETFKKMEEVARRELYELLLSRLSDQQRQQVLCRLGPQVLLYAAEVCDRNIKVAENLTEDLEFAIQDAINLIYYLKYKRGKAVAAEPLDDDDDPREQTADHSAISAKMYQALADSLVTGVVNLHSRIITTESFLVEPLTRLGKDLMRDYKHEVDEYIARDDMLTEQIVQFRDYVEKVANKKRADSTPGPSKARGTRKEAEPTPGTSKDYSEPTPGPSRNRKRTSEETQQPTHGSPRKKTSTEPTPGPSRVRTSIDSLEMNHDLPRKKTSTTLSSSRKRTNTDSHVEPTPGPSRMRTSDESLNNTPGSSRKKISHTPTKATPGRSRKSTSIEWTEQSPGPSRMRTSDESLDNTPGSSRKKTSHTPTKATPGPSRKSTSIEWTEQSPGPSRMWTSDESLNNTPGSSRKKTSHTPTKVTPGPSRKSTSIELPEQSPGPSRIRTSIDSGEHTPGSSKKKTSTTPIKTTPGRSRKSTSIDSGEHTPGSSKKKTSATPTKPTAGPSRIRSSIDTGEHNRGTSSKESSHGSSSKTSKSSKNGNGEHSVPKSYDSHIPENARNGVS